MPSATVILDHFTEVGTNVRLYHHSPDIGAPLSWVRNAPSSDAPGVDIEINATGQVAGSAAILVFGGVTTNYVNNTKVLSDCEASFKLTQNPGSGVAIQLGIRCTFTAGVIQSGYLWSFNPPNFSQEIRRAVGGVQSIIQTIPNVPMVIGDIYNFQMIGTTIKCFRNGTQLGTTMNGESSTASGLPMIAGLANQVTFMCIDDFTVNDLSGPVNFALGGKTRRILYI